MRILVAGANRVDAGKTTFTVGLVDRTDAVGYKPRAGNDYWFDQDQYRAVVGEGRLYGKDARRLAAASHTDVSPEEINAIHRLWRPSPGNTTGMLGQADREFVVDRVGETFVVNGTVDVPPRARDGLELEQAVRVNSLSEFNEVMQTVHTEVQRRLAKTIDGSDRAVVESYGDVARPYGPIGPDAVAVIEPARARIYDGTRYEKACEIASGSPGHGQLEERVSSVIDLIEPKATERLPALGSEQRGDPAAIADAYGPAYERLLGMLTE